MKAGAGPNEDAKRKDERLLAAFESTRDPRIRAQLVDRFGPLARSLARRYASFEDRDDLEQVALLGLVLAVDRYSSERGGFKGYAAATILGELRHHLRDRVFSIHLHRDLQESVARLSAAAEELSDGKGREPTIKELADYTKLSVEGVSEALQAKHARSQLSLDAPIAQSDGEIGTLLEAIPDGEAGFERVESAIAAGSAKLSRRELRVLRMYFGGGMKQSEIGDVMGVSQMQISRISRAAMVKLLESLDGKEPPKVSDAAL